MALVKKTSTSFGMDFPKAYHMISKFEVDKMTDSVRAHTIVYRSSQIRAAAKTANEKVEAAKSAYNVEREKLTKLSNPVKTKTQQSKVAAAEAKLAQAQEDMRNLQPLPAAGTDFNASLSEVLNDDGSVSVAKLYEAAKKLDTFVGATDA